MPSVAAGSWVSVSGSGSGSASRIPSLSSKLDVGSVMFLADRVILAYSEADCR